MLKLVLKGAAALVVLVVVAASAGLGYRAWRQHQNVQMLAIHSPGGVSEAGFVRIGGMDQWVQVRGEDRANPVILFLHGGPGYTAIPFNYPTMRSWERDFTMVDWDQRGAGKTFIHNGRSHGPGHNMERMVRDGIEMAEYVRHRLGKPKIIILGHSWGSILGTEMARRRPDLFYAYVGAGQVVDLKRNEAGSYWGLMEKVRAAGDREAEAKLRAIGPPPYAKPELLGRERDVLEKFPPALERDWTHTETMNLLYAPGYSLRDAFDVRNAQDLNGELFSDVLKYDAPARGMSFQVPMFFFQGAEDLVTPTSVVKDYFAKLQAPHKELVLFPAAGHHAVNVSSERFRAELVRRVRPYAIEPAPAAPTPARTQ